MWVLLLLLVISLYLRFVNRDRKLYFLYLIPGAFAIASLVSYSPTQNPALNLGGVAGFYFSHFMVKFFTKPFALLLTAYIVALPVIPTRYLRSSLLFLAGFFFLQLPFRWKGIFSLFGAFTYPIVFTVSALSFLLAFADLRVPLSMKWISELIPRIKPPQRGVQDVSSAEPPGEVEDNLSSEELVSTSPEEDEEYVLEDVDGGTSKDEAIGVENVEEPVSDKTLERTPENSGDDKKRWYEKFMPSRKEKSSVKEVVSTEQKPAVFFRENLLDVFEHGDEEEDYDDIDTESMARLIEEKFREYKINGRVVNATVGPVITRYEFEPAPGVKISTIQRLADDLALRLKVQNVRIVAPLPGKGLVGIEVPNKRRRIVYFGKLVRDEKFRNLRHPLSFIIGVEPDGTPRYENLAKMPHLLIAGTTGSGKSVSINTILASFLMKNDPDTLRLLLIDPKMVELTLYEGIPHLLMPIVKDRKFASKVLKMAVAWMEYRYRLLAQVGAKGLESYNKRVKRKLPYIVIVIDEFADLIMTQGKEVEEPLARLAQMARAVGIHLIVATQRPSVDVITGVIKANFPVRIAFKVPSKHDSRTILDTVGAERLLGKGDMLYIPPGSSEPIRLHGPFISEVEIRNLTHRLAGSYLKVKLLEKFGQLRDIDTLITDILDSGYIGAFTRDDEIALEQKRRIVAEWISRRMEEPQPVEEVEQVIDSLRSEYYIPIPEMEAYVEEEVEESSFDSARNLDPLLPEAIRIIASMKKASATMLQRKLRIGFSRAGRIVDQLEELGIVGPPDGSRPREVLITPDQVEDIIKKLKG